MTSGWYSLSLDVDLKPVSLEAAHMLEENITAKNKLKLISSSSLGKQLSFRFAREKQSGELSRIVLPSKSKQAATTATQAVIRQVWDVITPSQLSVHLIEMNQGPHLLLTRKAESTKCTWLDLNDEADDLTGELRQNEPISHFEYSQKDHVDCMKISTDSVVLWLTAGPDPQLVELQETTSSPTGPISKFTSNQTYILEVEGNQTILVNKTSKNKILSVKGNIHSYEETPNGRIFLLGDEFLHLAQITDKISASETQMDQKEQKTVESLKLPSGCQADSLRVVTCDENTANVVVNYAGKQVGLLTIKFGEAKDSVKGKTQTQIERWLPLAASEGLMVSEGTSKISIVYFDNSQTVLYLRKVEKPASMQDFFNSILSSDKQMLQEVDERQLSQISYETVVNPLRITDIDIVSTKGKQISDRYVALRLHEQPVTSMQVYEAASLFGSTSVEDKQQDAQSVHRYSVLFATHSSGAISAWKAHKTHISLWTLLETVPGLAMKVKRVPGHQSVRLEILEAKNITQMVFRSHDVSTCLFQELLRGEHTPVEEFCINEYTLGLESISAVDKAHTLRDVEELEGRCLFDFDEENGLFVLATGILYCIYTIKGGALVPCYQSILDNPVKYVAFKNMRLHLLDEHNSLLIYSLKFENVANKPARNSAHSGKENIERKLQVNFLYTEIIPRTLQAFSIEMEGYALGLSVEGQFFVSVTTANYPFTYVDDMYRVCTSNTIFLKSNLNNVAVADWTTEGGIIAGDILWLEDDGGLARALGCFQGVMEDGEIASKVVAVQAFDGAVKLLGFREAHSEKNCLFAAFSHYLGLMKQEFNSVQQSAGTQPKSQSRNCINMEILTEFIALTDQKSREEVFKTFKAKFIPQQIEPYYTMTSAEHFYKELATLVASTPQGTL